MSDVLGAPTIPSIPPVTRRPRTECLVTVFVEEDVEFKISRLSTGKISVDILRSGAASGPVTLFFRSEEHLQRFTNVLFDFLDEARLAQGS